jgi:hemolysin D
VVKVDSFPFHRYGTIAKVSRAAVDERAATELSNAANAARMQNATPRLPPKTQNLVFFGDHLHGESFRESGRQGMALMPGMAVTVETKIGQRRAIDYLLSPLREVLSETAGER